MDRILYREDGELADILASQLKVEGLVIHTGMRARKFSRDRGGIALEAGSRDGKKITLKAETALIAVGRAPNTEGLGLEAAGVAVSGGGLVTDRYLRTTAPNIYACGDVAGPYLFSHMAEYQAVIAGSNALLPLRRGVDYRNVAWCTFTDPELAHAGLTEEEARERHGGVRVYRCEYRSTDRGKTDAVDSGMSKIICTRRGKILGVHILGPSAGEIMHEAQLAKSMGIPFQKIGRVIHAYPSYSDVLRQPSKLFYVERLRENPVVKLAQKIAGKK
jgi:pyruvate/2-oxoglutarate dehydrogenase complex dihydrolipoamide dehydrogenase (E3) component